MTAIQLNAELYRAMGEIADDEDLMKKVLQYVKKLAAQKTTNSTMTREEYFEKINRAEQQIARGEGMEILPDEDLEGFLKRNGYNV